MRRLGSTLRALFGLACSCAVVVSCYADVIACAEDGGCPDALICIDRRCVNKPAGNAPCTSGASCATATLSLISEASGSASACQAGVCVTALCNKISSRTTPDLCPAGSVCGTPPSVPNSTCFADCATTPCPAGLSCVKLGYEGRMGCLGVSQAAPLDRTCSYGTDCHVGTNSLACTDGMCLDGCDGQRCPRERTCSPSGACVLDCSQGESCPNGLACTSLFNGKLGCARPDTPFNLCRSVEVTSFCAGGSDAACPGPTVACGTGTCPSGNPCTKASGAFTCAGCAQGFTPTTCGGVACEITPFGFYVVGGGTSCGDAGAWSCRRATPGCLDSTERVSGVCKCFGGKSVSFACGEKTSCKEKCATQFPGSGP